MLVCKLSDRGADCLVFKEGGRVMCSREVGANQYSGVGFRGGDE